MQNVLASPAPITRPLSNAQVWTARVVTGLIATFLLLDALGKLIAPAPIVEATMKLGFPVEAIRPLGVVLAISTLLHLIPRTQLIGAVLVTAYLGGATATHVHTSTPFWMPVVMGVLLWLAYAVQNAQLRTLALAAPAR